MMKPLRPIVFPLLVECLEGASVYIEEVLWIKKSHTMQLNEKQECGINGTLTLVIQNKRKVQHFTLSCKIS